MASGIAHEINTPVQFVNDSLHFISKASQDLLTIVEKYRLVGQASASGVAEAIREALAEERRADYAYIQKRLPKAVARSIDGLARVTSIVRSIKEFAHPDQKTQSATDLNAAIETTLTIARNEYKYVADVETDFAPLPPIVCYAGELNQVVLNIVVNAAHAIEEKVKGTDERGRITVRIFDRRRTGRGEHRRQRERNSRAYSGQDFRSVLHDKGGWPRHRSGLAIARSVIEKHGGTLGFKTQLGQGTVFGLRIPAQGKPEGDDGPSGSRSLGPNGGLAELRRHVGSCSRGRRAERVLDALEDPPVPGAPPVGNALCTGGPLAALEELARRSFDAIISDMRMPGMDGSELLTRVKDEFPGTARIVLSHADRASLLRALPVAHQILSKPCDPEALRRTLQSVLSSSTY